MVLLLACGCAASTNVGNPPCDRLEPAWLYEPEVQVGVRVEMRSDSCVYVYSVLNRSRDTLTLIQIGWDTDRKMCELTGVHPHFAPDTAYSPHGWESVPFQDADPMKFTLGWAMGRDSTGIPPGALVSGFAVPVRRPDSQYERCHWLIRFKAFPRAGYVGAVRPEGDLDIITKDTGTISGRVTDREGRGIGDALVFVWHSNASALTNAAGSYVMSNVPVGGLSLGARKVGFDLCDRAHIRVRASSETRIDFRLESMPASVPCVAYVTDRERIKVPFPADKVDTLGTTFEAKISRAYRGLGEDTLLTGYTAMGSRSFQNADEERLIHIAEETYPPPEAVLAVAKTVDRKALTAEKRLWWYGTFDGVRLPYAVTMDAVRYYLQLTQATGRGDSTQTGRIHMKRTTFKYNARIHREASYSRDGRAFQDVYIVEMKLSWSDYCGSLCACGFELDRTVVLRRDGTVLCVYGDRKPMVVVS